MSTKGRREREGSAALSPSRDTKRSRNVNCAQDKSIVLRYPAGRKYICPRGPLTARTRIQIFICASAAGSVILTAQSIYVRAMKLKRLSQCQ